MDERRQSETRNSGRAIVSEHRMAPPNGSSASGTAPREGNDRTRQQTAMVRRATVYDSPRTCHLRKADAARADECRSQILLCRRAKTIRETTRTSREEPERMKKDGPILALTEVHW
jgi:hypothetical protein